MANPVDKTMSIMTIAERVTVAGSTLASIAANTYLGIGGATPWTANSDDNIPTPNNSIDYANQVRRNLVAIKKVFLSDGAFVVQRVDWIANTFYDAFSNTINMYAKTQTVNANGTVTVNVGGNTLITGNGTTFLLDYANNDTITLPGDNVFTLPQAKEVINVVSNTSLIVNSAFSATYTNNVAEKTINHTPFYAKNFYVRNTYDQVFVCLDNNLGVASTDMPKISLGGQLPSNPYIIASDGYKWKYLYTISGGLKQKFFTSQWMPISFDTTVKLAATGGRLDIVRVLNGGIGYNNTAASFNAPILNVVGDGNGANVTAQVNSLGVITGINILNGGVDYTTATITANVGSAGSNAIISAVIGPQGGWGSNAAIELGATNIMLSISLNDTENNTIPTNDFLSEFFKYRQIALIDSPVLIQNGVVANSINFDTTTKIQCATVANFAMGDIAFQGPLNSFSNATFQGNVVWFDNTNNILHLNNISGTFNPALTMNDANNSHVSVVSLSALNPQIDIFSGSLNFIENRAAITRSPGQTENIKIVLQF
jgi:hypothetical protein